MSDALPRSGSVQVEINMKEGGRTTVSAIGPGALIEEENIACLKEDDPPAPLTTRTVIGAIVGHTARKFRIQIDITADPDRAKITLQPTS